MRFTPEMYAGYYAAQKGIAVDQIGVAPVVVISWAPKVVQAFARSAGARPVPHCPWAGRNLFYTGEVAGRRVSFAQVGIGAPATVVGMEEMIACGARLFLGLGWAGSLQPRVPVGTFLIPTRCVSEEGTSRHYAMGDAEMVPDDGLVGVLQAAAEAEGAGVVPGPHWTTDAPYRELCSKIAAYRAEGVLGVDMETSAMYALGQYRGVRVCNLLVVSDEIWGEWKPAFRTAELRVATKRAQQVIMRALGSDLLF